MILLLILADTSLNMALQYTGVALLLLIAVGRIIWGIRRHNRTKKSGSCCGCSLSDACRDYRAPKPGADPQKKDDTRKCECHR